jgi:two-component system, OmpR family, sensor kinase
MSLRLRLTLLYTTLLVGVLLAFGGLVYWLVNIMLIDQIDTSLTDNAAEIISLLHVNENNQFDVRSVAAFQPSENLVFQLWGSDQRLVLARPSSLTTPLDRSTQTSSQPVFDNHDLGKTHLRVLSVPLVNQRGRVGLLQLAVNLVLVDFVLRTLAVLLVLVAILASFIASVWIWVVNGRALAPLATVTDVAMQISRADDLSRRIPQASTTPGDEVYLLIQAFNNTLERLEQLFSSQRRFLADVSHELRTPLTVIKGNVGLMRKMGQADEESLESIEAEVDRLTRMVGDLLLLAQAESGRVPLDNSPVELDTILLEVFQQMRLLAGDRLQIRILEIDQVQVRGDRDRLKQVLLNLVANAVQYTPAGGKVSLELRKTEDQAQVIVSDTGPGIPAQDLPHIFERFYRGEKSRKRGQGSGFGLGLSIAYWIVRNHGGNIEVTSQEGVGTRFCIWLPLAEKTRSELSVVKE